MADLPETVAGPIPGPHWLRKRPGALDLTVFGVGVVIGIFVLTGKAAGVQAGPAVALSFVFAGVACALAALCSAEFASTVAVGWSTYFADVMNQAGIDIPAWAYDEGHNLVAATIVLILTGVICMGIKVSSQVNLVMVVIKVAVVLFVIIAGLFYIKTSNYFPFIPPSGSAPAAGTESVPSLLQDLGFAPGSFGITGIFTGAALLFFAFIGFDIVATAAEETKKPQRDMPIAILGSLAICTALYVAVSLVITGMVKYTDIKVDAPLAEAFRSVGKPGFATAISVGALVGLTTVTTGIVGAVISTSIPLAELVNIGTLFAFILVAVGVLVLRRKRPDLDRAFRCPGVPVAAVWRRTRTTRSRPMSRPSSSGRLPPTRVTRLRG